LLINVVQTPGLPNLVIGHADTTAWSARTTAATDSTGA